MRKKNGFTIVEIISVISLLLVIATISMPAVVNYNKNTKERNYNRIVRNIETVAENFVEYYRSDIPFDNTGKYCFKLNVLANLNYIKTPLTDPRTGNEIVLDEYIEVSNTNSDGTLTYTYPANNCSSWESNNGTNYGLKLTLSTNNTYVKKDSKVNIVFLSDSTTTDELNSKISSWKNELITNSNSNVTNYIYADTATLGKFSLSNSTEVTFRSVDDGLSKLKTKIVSDS